jgi:hypothetical protein
MTDLSQLEDLNPSMVLSTIFQNCDVGLPRDFVMFRRVYIRLCDKAVFEYRCSNALLEGDGSKVFRALRFTDHMENVVNAVRRCYGLFDKLKSSPKLLPVERTERRLFEKELNKLRPIRDTIEHFEERLQSDIGENDPIMIRVSSDGKSFYIGSHSILISDFERMLVRTHGIAKALLLVQVEHNTDA